MKWIKNVHILLTQILLHLHLLPRHEAGQQAAGRDRAQHCDRQWHQHRQGRLLHGGRAPVQDTHPGGPRQTQGENIPSQQIVTIVSEEMMVVRFNFYSFCDFLLPFDGLAAAVHFPHVISGLRV